MHVFLATTLSFSFPSRVSLMGRRVFRWCGFQARCVVMWVVLVENGFGLNPLVEFAKSVEYVSLGDDQASDRVTRNGAGKCSRSWVHLEKCICSWVHSQKYTSQ